MKEFKDAAFWQGHIEKAAEFGSIPQYCIENQISKSAFYWNRAKLKKHASEQAPVKRVKRKLSTFLPVIVSSALPVQKKELPEAKWVAEFLICFLGGIK